MCLIFVNNLSHKIVLFINFSVQKNVAIASLQYTLLGLAPCLCCKSGMPETSAEKILPRCDNIVDGWGPTMRGTAMLYQCLLYDEHVLSMGYDRALSTMSVSKFWNMRNS